MKYTFFLLLYFLLTTHLTYGQEWEITPYHGRAYQVVEAPNENFYVTGEWRDEADTTINHSHIAAINQAGELQWIKQLEGIRGERMTQLQDGHLLICSLTDDSPERKFILQKVNLNGELLWAKPFDAFFFARSGTLLEAQDGSIYFTGIYWKEFVDEVASDSKGFLYKFDSEGELQWKEEFNNNISHLKDIQELSNGNLILDERGAADAMVLAPNGNLVRDYALELDFDMDRTRIFPGEDDSFTMIGHINTGDLYFVRADLNGNLITAQLISTPKYESVFDAAALPDGGFAITGWREAGDIFLYKINAEGQIVWDRNFGLIGSDGIPRLEAAEDVDFTMDGGLILAGSSGPPYDAYLIKTDADGKVYDHLLTGRVFFDENLDCEAAVTETGMQNWIIRAESDGHTAYAVSDAQGNYSMLLGKDDYEITMITEQSYWTACTTYSVDFGTERDTQVVAIGLQPVLECPLLEVNITNNRLRRCADNTFDVSYCNRGTLAEEEVYIEVIFDEHITVNAAQVNFTQISDHLYRFEVGELPVSACGSFAIYTSLDCDPEVSLGQTHCVEANIFPDAGCHPVDDRWDGVNIVTSGSCSGDSIVFQIRNEGNLDMPEPLEYVVIQDQIILKTSSFQLNASESMQVVFPAEGGSFSLLCQQSKYLPTNQYPGATVTGCGGFTPGYAQAIPDNDAEPWRSIFCRQNSDSYDPNDKQSPLDGIGPDHLIATGTNLEYLIRFQNTGNDTAYQVVIRDTIAEQLDIHSIRMLHASHDYSWTIEEERTLVFTFDNILLPDSTTNPVASQGYIGFSLQQAGTQNEGTVIQNQAAIYFDRNLPIITNTVFHTIGSFFQGRTTAILRRNPVEQFVKVFPNPGSEWVRFEIIRPGNKSYRFRLFSAYGQLIREQVYPGSFDWHRGNLTDGLYFYELQVDGGLYDSGRLMLVR